MADFAADFAVDFLADFSTDFPADLFFGRREKTPTPKTRFSIWTLLRTPGCFLEKQCLGRFRGFFVVFSWLLRGPHLLRKFYAYSPWTSLLSNDICVATGITERCRDARCRQCTGKRLSRTIWPSFNRERGSHICVTVRLPVRPRGDTMHWQANSNTPLLRHPLERCKGHTHKGHGGKELKVMNFRVFSGYSQGVFRELQDILRVFFPMPFPGMPFGPLRYPPCKCARQAEFTLGPPHY